MRPWNWTWLIGLLLAPALAGAEPAAYRVPEELADGWRSADAGRLGWNTAKLGDIQTRIAAQDLKGITSVLVADRGRLVYEQYFNGGARDTPNDMRSATKTLTAALAGVAIDRGLIANASAKVYPYFRDLGPLRNADPRKEAFTLEDLLTMSSLWECDDDNPFSSGNEERMYVTENWLRFALELPIKGFAPWMAKPADSPYGRAFSYCTAGSFVAGAVVERAARRSLDAFAAEVLEKPLGIATSQWNRSPDGIVMGGGGTRYRSRDIAKIGAVLADGGRWQGRPVISSRWVEAMLTPHAKAREDAEYGYLIWRFHYAVDGKDRAVWAMSGNGGNYVFVLPEQGLVAVITSRAYNQRNAHAQSQELFRDLVLAAAPAAGAAR
ncbi:serine hydrolase [Dokdonella sp.]|uniref:serine hydrolase domain-containing protein n=1 Tax=Dokdonella sp. TaxID=2291710 RepID=UPI001B1099B7|nr:serine hydrolase [Dokdonella sp.]MBO9661660.1 serine hydrolase [Dokdonella sp.]